MAGSYCCVICLRSWPPDLTEFKTCPGLKCEDRVTDWVGNSEPDWDLAEAKSIKRHLLFEKWYEAEWPRVRAERDAAFEAITGGVELTEPGPREEEPQSA